MKFLAVAFPEEVGQIPTITLPKSFYTSLEGITPGGDHTLADIAKAAMVAIKKGGTPPFHEVYHKYWKLEDEVILHAWITSSGNAFVQGMVMEEGGTPVGYLVYIDSTRGRVSEEKLHLELFHDSDTWKVYETEGPKTFVYYEDGVFKNCSTFCSGIGIALRDTILPWENKGDYIIRVSNSGKSHDHHGQVYQEEVVKALHSVIENSAYDQVGYLIDQIKETGTLYAGMSYQTQIASHYWQQASPGSRDAIITFLINCHNLKRLASDLF